MEEANIAIFEQISLQTLQLGIMILRALLEDRQGTSRWSQHLCLYANIVSDNAHANAYNPKQAARCETVVLPHPFWFRLENAVPLPASKKPCNSILLSYLNIIATKWWCDYSAVVLNEALFKWAANCGICQHVVLPALRCRLHNLTSANWYKQVADAHRHRRAAAN